MNCKEGDLALIVKESPNMYRLVRVISRSTDYPDDWNAEAMQPMVMSRTTLMPTGSVGQIRDAFLVPIRNIPGQDQTLTWCALPQTADV